MIIVEDIILKKILKHKDTPILNYNIKYPKFTVKTNPKTEKMLNKFYFGIIKYYISFLEKTVYKKALDKYLKSNEENKFRPFNAIVNYNITYPKENFISIYTEFTLYTGVGNGIAVKKSQTWDFEKLRLAFLRVQ